MKFVLIATLAVGGLAATSAGAGPPAGHGGGLGAGLGVGLGAGPPVAPPAATRPNPGRIERNDARINRESPNRASPNGVANANENAGLSSATVGDLSGLKTGLTVKDSTGVTLGTVSKIETSKDGKVSNVLVASANGSRTIRLPPTSLSISGDVVTTTASSPPR